MVTDAFQVTGSRRRWRALRGVLTAWLRLTFADRGCCSPWFARLVISRLPMACVVSEPT